ncbi:ABC transporter permease [Salibacteraceae bacterium]|nr:ABC transporter permease [Salibacteraceae bacterium]MDB9709482.1 ABC transporter permease [Salibacteraceae bacterium]MDC1304733.1 ABC transporter permease [Salibacteraceae bacterium]
MSANKIGLIIRREYFTRVRKKSFIIMSLLGPLIMAGVLTFAMWTSIEESDDQKILVIDDNYPFFEKLDGSDKLSYSIMDISLPKGEALLEVSDYTALLYLPENILQSKSGQLIFKKQPSIKVQRQIEETVQQYLEISKLKEFDITEGDYNRLKAPFNLLTFQFKGAGAEAEETNMLPAIVGLVFGILIYFFIFMYSVQVMRGVIEEKTNRIIEVMISSVKPFQLMMGKIIGVGAIGLTQFALWILLTLVLALGGQFLVLGDKYDAAQVKTPMTDMVQQQVDQEQSLNLTRLSQKDNLFNKIRRINFPVMIAVFIFYFLGGYLLYSALMAAVGSAVDNDTDTQQFIFPITFPLLLAYILSFNVFENPSSDMAIWLSIIPLTSPVIMMIRVAIGIESADMWQVYLSMALLVGSFIGAVWMSGKIYRVGILMYGKKPSLKEIFKWLKY